MRGCDFGRVRKSTFSGVMEIKETVNDRTPRWYILRLAKSTVKANEELEREAKVRKEAGRPALCYFAPIFQELSERRGKAKLVSKPLCLNYVFIRATVEELRSFRADYPDYNFVKRAKTSPSGDFLYVRDDEMRMFMAVARVYNDVVPCYAPDRRKLSKGDKVRIIGGEFAGVEGILLTQKGKDGGRVVINVCNCLAVPTLSIRPEYIKIISFASDNKHIYKKLDSFYPRIRRAMHNHVSGIGIDESDTKNVSFFLSRFGDIDIPSDKVKARYLAFLLMSHTVLRHDDDRRYYAVRCADILREVTNPTTRAFILVALYHGTADKRYLSLAQDLVDTWKSSASLSQKQRDVMEDIALCLC